MTTTSRTLHILLALGLWLAAVSPALAAKYRFRASVEVGKESSIGEMTDQEMGEGALKRVNRDSVVTIRSMNFDEVEGVTLKLYVFANAHVWDKSDIKPFLLETLVKPDLTVPANQKMEVKMGTLQFASFETKDRDDNERWRGGTQLYGWALELIIDGKVILEEFKDRGSEKYFGQLQAGGS